MIGGGELWPKNISPFNTVTPVVVYHMLNLGHNATILSKILTILLEARYKADAEEWGYKDTGHNIPEMGICLSVKKIHGWLYTGSCRTS